MPTKFDLICLLSPQELKFNYFQDFDVSQSYIEIRILILVGSWGNQVLCTCIQLILLNFVSQNWVVWHLVMNQLRGQPPILTLSSNSQRC